MQAGASSWAILLLWAVLQFATVVPCPALPAKLGDLDEDGVATILDIAKLAAHFRGTHPLSPAVALFADMNQDGALNEADQEELAREILQVAEPRDLPLTTVREISPASGEGDVAVTRETIIHFAHPLSPFTSIDTTRFRAEFGGRKILSCVQLAPDRKKVGLYYLEPLPSNARVNITFDGNGLNDLLGRSIDVDGDGLPGGVFTSSFETISTLAVPNTGVTGVVYASERGTGGAEVPLAGVTITVDGAEESLRCTTAADGSFTLSPCPSGTFFVHIDGRTSPLSSFPDGSYYPSVGKKWFAQPGRLDNPAGDIDDTPAGGGTGVIYLPCVCAGTLLPVSQTQDTAVTFPPEVLAARPELAATILVVPANSLFADDGTRGGRVGIAPVAPDRIPSPLPPGLNPPVVFTVQSDGATNFDAPVSVCLPNLPDPVTGETLLPGSKSALFSFNHDVGEWEMAGAMTVSEDGTCVTTDAGVGIRQPGWHVSQPGVFIEGVVVGSCEDLQYAAFAVVGKVIEKISRIALIESAKRAFDVARYITQSSKQSGVETAVKILNAFRNAKSCLDHPEGIPGAMRCLKGAVSSAGISQDASGFGPIKWLRGSYDKVRPAVDATILVDDLEPYLQRFQSAVSDCRGNWNGTNALERLGITREDLVGRQVRAGALVTEAIEALDELDTELEFLAGDDSFEDATIDDVNRVMSALERGAAVLPAAHAALEAYSESVDRSHVAIKDLLKSIHSALDTVPLPESSCETQGKIVARLCLPSAGLSLGSRSTRRAFGIFAPANAHVRIQFADVACRAHAQFDARTGDAGTVLRLPRLPTSKSHEPDSDGDGLGDVFEIILGTDPFLVDSDGDGAPDGSIASGWGGIGNPIGAGAVSSIAIADICRDVASSQTSTVASCGRSGTVFLLTDGASAPVNASSLATNSASLAVGVGGNSALIAESEAGFRCVSLDELLTVTQSTYTQVTGRAISATAGGSIAYGGTSQGEIWEFDLSSGAPQRQLGTGAGDIEDLALAGDWLFARKPDRLLAIDLSGVEMVVAGELVLSTGRTPSPNRLRISVGEDAVFCTRGDGCDIIDLSTLPTLTLKGAVSGPGNDWRHFVPNGSVGVLAGKVQTSGNPSAQLPVPASLFTIPAAGNSISFATSYEMPGKANSVAINRGIAYVACDNGTLAVVNYLDFDRNGLPPTIALGSNIDLAAAMPEAVEGSLMRLSASVDDDVQVGNVEFYVDGERVFDDGSYPFEHRFLVPRRSTEKSEFSVRARAFDTGGNAAWSTETTVALLPDMTPPVVRRVLPAAGTMNLEVSDVHIRFNEWMDVTTLVPPGMRVTEAGVDDIHGTGDDVEVSYFLVYRDTDSLARLALGGPLHPGRYRVDLGTSLTDATGNAMAAPFVSEFRVFSLEDADGDGLPDDWEELLGSDAALADSDGNGTLDGDEDRDGDGTADGIEIIHLRQDPRVTDRNGNGVPDGFDDSDSDGFLDWEEALAGTDIYNSDTDGDGLDDGTEVASGLDPLVSDASLTLTASSAATSILNAIPEVTPLIPTPANSGPTALLNAVPEETPLIPTPVQSGPTSFENQ